MTKILLFFPFFFLFCPLLAIEYGNGSDGTCLFSGVIPAKVYNCRNVLISSDASVTGSSPLIIYSTDYVEINAIISVIGEIGSSASSFDANISGGNSNVGGNQGGSYFGISGPLTNIYATQGESVFARTGGFAGISAQNGGIGGEGAGGGGGGGGANKTNGKNNIEAIPLTFADDGIAGQNGNGGEAINYTITANQIRGGGGGGSGSHGFVNDQMTGTKSAGGGGAGGGAIFIAASGKIIISESGEINAFGGNGGNGLDDESSAGDSGGGGGGAGGTIYLASATSIEIQGSINVNGGLGGAGGGEAGGGGGDGGRGRIRLEAPGGKNGGLINIIGSTILPSASIIEYGAVAQTYESDFVSSCGSIAINNTPNSSNSPHNPLSSNSSNSSDSRNINNSDNDRNYRNLNTPNIPAFSPFSDNNHAHTSTPAHAQNSLMFLLTFFSGILCASFLQRGHRKITAQH